jgi:hypothetical protein
MRLHRNLVYTTIDSLNAIFNEGEYADKVVARALKKDKRWGSSDRKFVAETIYEIVRWKRLYGEIAEVKEPYDRDDLWRMFAVWAVLKRLYNSRLETIGRNTSNAKLKVVLMNYPKLENTVNLFQIGWMKWV